MLSHHSQSFNCWGFYLKLEVWILMINIIEHPLWSWEDGGQWIILGWGAHSLGLSRGLESAGGVKTKVVKLWSECVS